MKRLIFSLTTVAALLAGCQKPEIVDHTDVVESVQTQFVALIEGFDVETKTSMDADRNVLWSLDDHIAIFRGSALGEEYKLDDAAAGQGNGVFNPVGSVGGDTFFAGTEIPCNVGFYPYASNLSLARRGEAYEICNVEISSLQTYTPGTFANGAFPMVAITDSEDDYILKFKNVLGAIKLQLKGSKVVKFIKIEGGNGEILSGPAVITANSDNKTNSIEMVGSDESSKSVTLDCGDGVELSTSLATEFIIALPPVTFSKGFSVTITYSDDTQQTFEAMVENTVYRSSILVMPVCFLDGDAESEIEGVCPLYDTGYSLYYDNSHSGLSDEITLVLSNGVCHRNRLDEPYLVSDGDMVVITIKTPYSLANGTVSIPTGEFDIIENNDDRSRESYVAKAQKGESTKWDIKSGSVVITAENDGIYTIATENLILKNESEEQEAGYVCKSFSVLTDYNEKAPFHQSSNDDIINMPFTYLKCNYYGNILANGTGNFLVSMATKGFIEVDSNGTENMTDVPGLYITLNFISSLYAGSAIPILEKGRYTVSGTLSRWSLMPGMLMDGTPFGTYLIQLTASGEGIMEYVKSGYVDVDYPDEENPTYCVMTYSLETSKRIIEGVWRGEMPVNNLAEASTDTYFSTLDKDVDCDMSKVSGGSLTLIETLHRNNVEAELDYDIAEAWQLYLGPRDWNNEEKVIPWSDEGNAAGADGIVGTDDDWMYDKNQNGIRDRLEAWCGDGDVMILEFILPLGSQGVIAPELNKTYTYTMQPSLEIDHQDYEVYVSRMGRPADEIFDPMYASQYPGWVEQLGITSYDRCNARRGFARPEDDFRGNWYMHYKTGNHMILDEHAPAINGEVKVTRTGDNTYDFEWNFIDDYPGTPNRITGSIKDCQVNIHLK